MKSGITILKSLVTFLCVPRVYLWTLESIFSQSGSSLLSWATRILSITSQIRATRLPFQAFFPWSGLHLPLQLCLWLLKSRVHCFVLWDALVSGGGSGGGVWWGQGVGVVWSWALPGGRIILSLLREHSLSVSIDFISSIRIWLKHPKIALRGKVW